MATVAGVVRSQYDGEPLTGPLRVRFNFQLLRPKGHYKTGKNAGNVKDSFINAMPTVKPDLTKLIRSTEDALSGILFRDDCQIVETLAKKDYVTRDPGVEIEVEIK
jgi:Holliday junction resolvase RusA-like endonuclease